MNASFCYLLLMYADLATGLQAQLADLARLTLEAQDNVNFLLTLERHFNTIATGSLDNLAETLHPMLNALRMVCKFQVVVEQPC